MLPPYAHMFAHSLTLTHSLTQIYVYSYRRHPHGRHTSRPRSFSTVLGAPAPYHTRTNSRAVTKLSARNLFLVQVWERYVHTYTHLCVLCMYLRMYVMYVCHVSCMYVCICMHIILW